MTKKFDPTKPVQTRDGRKAGIYGTDHDGMWPIVGWIENDNGKRKLATWTESGRYHQTGRSKNDLVNEPEIHVRWINVYSVQGVSVHKIETGQITYDSRHEAFAARSSARQHIATIRIEFEEGEGIDV